MKTYTQYILFFMCLLLSVQVSAQGVKLGKANTKYPGDLKAADRGNINSTLDQLLTDYAKAATLLDDTENKVTFKSMTAFKDLFNPTAQVIRDYEEYYQEGSISISNYTDQIYNRMFYKGLKVKILKAELVEVKYDPAGYWVATIDMEKVFSNAATSNQDVKDLANGRFMNQRMTIDVRASNLDRAKISKISCLDCKSTISDNFERFLGPSLGLHIGNFNPSLSSHWNNNHASAGFDTKAKLGFSIGLDFVTNEFIQRRATSKDIFLMAGLRYSIYNISTEVNDFALDAFPATAFSEDDPTISLDYLRSARDIQFTEDISINVLEIPVGAAYRLYNNNKSSVLLGFNLVPTIVMSGSGDINGTGTYDAQLDSAMWRLLEEKASNSDQIDEDNKFGPFKAGEQLPISMDADPSLSAFSLGLQISPRYYYHTSEDESSWSIMVGIDINAHLGSFISHDNAGTDILQFSDDYATSFLQHYTDGMSGISLGLRVGFQHHLSRRP